MKNADQIKKLINRGISLLCFNLFLFAFLPLSMAHDFETKRMKDVYLLLPENIRKNIEVSEAGKDISIKSDQLIPGSRILIRFNTEKQISMLGLNLFPEPDTRGKYGDACLFVENTLLHLLLLEQTPAVSKEIQGREITLLLNDQPVKTEKYQIPFSEIIKSKKLSLNLEDNNFVVSWNLLSGGRLAMQFPADLNLMKGMDKGELEADLLCRIKIFAMSDIIISQNQNYRGDQKIQSGLYIQKGIHFENDDFRSDIYLSKKNEKEYLPVFSPKYPVESFSNLFLCNLQSTVDVDLTMELYGNKKEKQSLKLKKLQAFLSENTDTYFGLQSLSGNQLKATLVYYDPTYRYIHMMIVEMDKSELFKTEEKNMRASLYMYIPQANFTKEIIYE